MGLCVSMADEQKRHFRGVSLCPGYVTENAKHPFLIFCNCRRTINLKRAGIYEILPATDTQLDEDAPHYHKWCVSERDEIFRYIRVFPAVAYATTYEKTPGIKWGKRFFPHTNAVCDLILTTELPADNRELFRPLEYRPTVNPRRHVFL